MTKTFVSAFLAGALIAMGCGIYTLSGGGVVGALLFCLGLLTICHFKLDLFTGKVGFMLIEDKIQWGKLLIILIGNLVGAVFMGTFLGYTDINLMAAAATLINSKLEIWPRVLGSSFITGILMYLAVALYKDQKPIGIFLCVPAFLLSGFDHCIALAGYIAMGAAYSWFALGFLTLAIIGNTAGSSFISTILNYIKEKQL